MLLCSVVEKVYNVNSSEVAADCFKMFGVSDLAEVVATRKDKFFKKYVLSSSVLSARYVLFVVKFSFHFNSIFILCINDSGKERCVSCPVCYWQQDMTNSLRKSYVPLFSC